MTFIRIIFILNIILISSPAFCWEKTEEQMKHFVVIGDTGKQTLAQREVADSMMKHCEINKCDAAFLLGDNVYHAGMDSVDDPIMDVVFKDYYQNLNFPFYAILGNHDYGKLSFSLRKAEYQLEYSKRNPQFIMPARYYYREFENVVVVFLDTTRMMWRKDIAVQAEMIEEAHKIAQASNKWFIVVGHHPYLSNGDHGNAGHYDRVKLPYFVSGKYVKKFLDQYVCQLADVYFSGHDHSLQMMPGNQIGCKSYIIVSGAGGSGSSLHERNIVDFQSTDPGYFHLDVSANKLSISAINSKAEEIFSKAFERN
jgi:tartrate-resistant acid phosphatase type 5